MPVMKFLKYKDNTGTARNTLRSYYYALKLYFEFLEQKELSYTDVGIDELALKSIPACESNKYS
ncbi:hypothetical protein P4530_13340 [Bacillus thuringiensis]|nr:hypothetical protein [Bacillus thuringiensis]